MRMQVILDSSFARPGSALEFSPYMGREERRVQGLDYDWLSYLRTQLAVFVGGVCLFAKQGNFFSAVFSKQFFSPEEETLKSYKSKGICSIALKSLKKRESLREFYGATFALATHFHTSMHKGRLRQQVCCVT